MCINVADVSLRQTNNNKKQLAHLIYFPQPPPLGALLSACGCFIFPHIKVWNGPRIMRNVKKTFFFLQIY